MTMGRRAKHKEQYAKTSRRENLIEIIKLLAQIGSVVVTVLRIIYSY
jgi:hypothetical protein